MRNLGDFVPPQQYARQAAQASGAQPVSGMAPYPLYGIPTMGDVDTTVVPIYRRPLVCFGAGAAVVGIAWAYFGWWRPRSKKTKRNSVTVEAGGEE
jgi:hypothetical protein